MDFSLTEAEHDLAGLCRDFAQKEIAVRAPGGVGGARSAPPTCSGRWASSGLLGMLVPEEWGGIGMTTVGFVAAMEQIGLADQSVAAAWQAHVTIGSLPLLLFGNDDQRERWLRPLAEGRVLGAFGLTEPDAGSDARGIRTRAERRDGGWLINGAKTFISNAGTDMSFGRDPAGPHRRRPTASAPRFASFVVEKDTPGFTMGPKMRGIGWKGLDTRELFFDDVWVPDDHLVGDPEMGLGQFLAHPRGRPHLHRRAVAQPHPGRARPGHRLRPGARAVRPAHRRASRPSSSSWPTSPPSSRRPAGSPTAPPRSATPASRSSRRRRWPSSRPAASPSPPRPRPSRSTAASATCSTSPVARFYCDAKVLEIGEGTNEIQHVVIARTLGC